MVCATAARLAPLSQGRIEPSDGTLQCSYHGWRFEGSGAAAAIPQAAHESPEAEQKSIASKRSCVATYPTQACLFSALSLLKWAIQMDKPLL